MLLDIQGDMKAIKNTMNELKKQNAELKKQDKICEEIIIGEQIEIDRLNKENTELKEQIEKMKRCSNCSFNFGGCKFVLRIKDDVTPFVKLHKDLFCINYDKWELAE